MSTEGGNGGSFIHALAKALAELPSSEEPPIPSSPMLSLAGRRLRRLCCGLRWPHRRSKTKVIVKALNNNTTDDCKHVSLSSNHKEAGGPVIRIATFNAAMFSMAPAVPAAATAAAISQVDLDIRGKAANDRPMKGILKQQKFSASKRRVSINLPEDEISVERSRQINGKAPAVGRSPSFHAAAGASRQPERSVLEVLREANADLIALQNVKAEEEKGMRPLSDLAQGLGMRYVFAESWAPEYGNAIFSKWPIKSWIAQKICDDTDFRNVLKATIDVPGAGEVNFHCTHLDHLDESWRMKQISTILGSSDSPHILAGGLNSLDETDYSAERWNDIVKYYEEIGKPTPKVEVMKFLKGRRYSDAKDYAGECESVVVVAKGQDVQGTCKYGTRVDYILASPNSPYRFVPGSYGVISSKGTSDHHIAKVDVVIDRAAESINRRRQQRVVKMDMEPSKGIWGANS